MLAIIPARSGSKGLPGKNIKKLLGKPMIAYTIEAALNSKYVDDVIVSTDSREIETIAKNFGAKSYFLRPKLLASDESNAIDNLNNDFNYSIDDFVVLQPTSPLRVSKDIDAAIDIFYKKKADSVISYSEESHPLKWHKYISKDGRFENIFDDSLLNRQEFRTSFYPNGAIYVFKFGLIKRKHYYNNNSFAYIMPRARSVDVDTFDDFQYIEFLMSKFNDRKP